MQTVGLDNVLPSDKKKFPEGRGLGHVISFFDFATPVFFVTNKVVL